MVAEMVIDKVIDGEQSKGRDELSQGKHRVFVAVNSDNKYDVECTDSE